MPVVKASVQTTKMPPIIKIGTKVFKVKK